MGNIQVADPVWFTLESFRAALLYQAARGAEEPAPGAQEDMPHEPYSAVCQALSEASCSPDPDHRETPLDPFTKYPLPPGVCNTCNQKNPD